MTQTPDFDSIIQINPYGIEYWSARDLMPLLGYKKWQKFEDAIKRAMTACTQSDNIVDQHFTDAGKTSPMPRGGVRAKADYNLSRFACYLIAQNGDPRKPEIAAAQVYFAVSTRAHEIHQLREEQRARLEKRLEVSESFNALGRAARNAGVQSKSFGIFIVVREAIKKAQQPLPETLPTEPSIRKLVEEHRRKQKRALKAKDEQEGQPSLFDEVEA